MVLVNNKNYFNKSSSNIFKALKAKQIRCDCNQQISLSFSNKKKLKFSLADVMSEVMQTPIINLI